MRFLTLLKFKENLQAGPPPPALMEAIGKLGAEAAAAGVLVDTAGLAPTAASTVVRLSDGKLTSAEGVAAGPDELVTGAYAIYEVSSEEEVLEWVNRFMKVHQEHGEGWEGETEVRRVFGPEDFAPPQG